MNYKVEYNNWLTEPKINAEAYEELSAISENEKEIEYRLVLNFNSARQVCVDLSATVLI